MPPRLFIRAFGGFFMSNSAASLRGRIGAYSLHAQYDPRETTKAGRQAFLDSFANQVDPENALPPDERARRAEMLKKAYFTRLALASVKAREKKCNSESTATENDKGRHRQEAPIAMCQEEFQNAVYPNAPTA